MNSINPFLYLLERADFTVQERYFLRSMFSIKDCQNPLYLPDEILFRIVDELNRDKPSFTEHDLIFLQANLNEDKNVEDLLLATQDPIKQIEITQQWKIIENRLEQIWSKLNKWERDRMRAKRRGVLFSWNSTPSEEKYKEWKSPIVLTELRRIEKENQRLLQRQQRQKRRENLIYIFLFTVQIWLPLLLLITEFLVKKYKKKIAENNRNKEQKDNYWGQISYF